MFLKEKQVSVVDRLFVPVHVWYDQSLCFKKSYDHRKQESNIAIEGLHYLSVEST